MKIPRVKLLRLALWAFLTMALAAAVDVASQAASPEEPAAVARDFYAWYLSELKGNRDPLDDERPSLERYVAPSLVAEIVQMMESPDGMEEDYFIKAQDYLDGWLGHVTATRADLVGDNATTVVTLGKARSDLWRLRVMLIKNPQGEWRIRRVAKD